MSPAKKAAVGDVGRHVSAFSSALRPRAIDELRAWGGVRLVRGKRVLDLGSGDGRLALGIAPWAASVEALDPDERSIAAARKVARESGVRNARFSVGAAQKLTYPDATFDLVILSWTL
jgi:ubiquinone/menaquinone biosynthesis C-methylase UbiE